MVCSIPQSKAPTKVQSPSKDKVSSLAPPPKKRSTTEAVFSSQSKGKQAVTIVVASKPQARGE